MMFVFFLHKMKILYRYKYSPRSAGGGGRRRNQGEPVWPQLWLTFDKKVPLREFYSRRIVLEEMFVSLIRYQTCFIIASRFPLHPQALYPNSSIDERGEKVPEEDHTYELLLTAQTKHPAPGHESKSNKGRLCCMSGL